MSFCKKDTKSLSFAIKYSRNLDIISLAYHYLCDRYKISQRATTYDMKECLMPRAVEESSLYELKMEIKTL